MAVPRIGVSACLLGKKVRYDGGHQFDRDLVDRLSQRFETVPICPEYEAGLGVPREPMHLVGNPVSPRLWEIETGRDLTDQLVDWCRARVEELVSDNLCGVVLKSCSPSCGLALVDVLSSEGVVLGEGPGLFVRALMERLPGLPLVESESVRAPRAYASFITKAESYALRR